VSDKVDGPSLGSLPLGRSAIVVGYAQNCNRRRFVEMGFVPGVRITAVRAAPLGDPVEYAVMGSRVTVRRRDAAALMVDIVES
jgi:Fe2+ transport system protein FeoA